ncbi:hypothetical protein ACR78Z_12805 [Sphingobacterium thalpophilum]|uniref:hypothetical protein n=1 Tax=Sphingobacterium thalpophilum TaxID=259 RepID=UPI003DA27211
MKAISKRQHRTLIAALQQLEELQQSGVLCVADGFLPHIQSLSERFAHYEALLNELAETISEYEALYKKVRVNVVAPALRQVKKNAAHSSRHKNEQHQLVVEYAKVASGV